MHGGQQPVSWGRPDRAEYCLYRRLPDVELRAVHGQHREQFELQGKPGKDSARRIPDSGDGFPGAVSGRRPGEPSL